MVVNQSMFDHPVSMIMYVVEVGYSCQSYRKGDGVSFSGRIEGGVGHRALEVRLPLVRLADPTPQKIFLFNTCGF